VRVIVAEDQLLTREGIVRTLRDAGVEVVAEATDVAGLMRAVRFERPDVAIVDIRLPPSHTDEGLRAADEIRSEHPETGVLILSQHLEVSYVTPLLERGVDRIGYLLKDRILEVATLVDAVRRIAAGECVIDPGIIAELLRAQRPPPRLAEMTEREREVLALVAEGLSNAGVGKRLFISERTVEVYTRQVFRKLDLPENPTANRRVLAALAYLGATA
jgi:DNA-binding NarL/FixJ family response regulator